MKSADRKIEIIKTAMELFAQKGASSTSMQEIAERCGISKGSLYLLFKSKEELQESVYLYCFRKIRDPLLALEQETGLSPKDMLRSQVEAMLTHMYELREFLQRAVRDLAESDPLEPPAWLCRIFVPLIRWFERRLESVYGQEILPYTGELWLLAQGMIESYIRVIFHPRSPLTPTHSAVHLVQMLDIAAEGLMASRPDPLLSADTLTSLIAKDEDDAQSNPFHLIREMKESAAGLPGLSPEESRDIRESLSILESELLSVQPRRAIIKGMLLNLQSCPGLAALASELENLTTPCESLILSTRK
ncbi:TetR/AcrR family transcriptional regulator [Paenibacillus sp. HN-1]|uniref:TetR/AcrR family transcriptional regulator n=1 Tax=Paenibacillus TaxID=44249 RepID=UPI001CA8008F|nr:MULTISPECIES: TetR/AcrR family transcriptional regulator [Paenibacillus]MBY9077667.1 TetR/AcrR family transcriptional regulator [Paenibacillus sp. CGMCC 1.18879]MBY9087408.1 TetR/AcrR family transcriptional regulator [Paenibacillus sinensis]